MPAISRMLRFGALLMLSLGLVFGTPTTVSADSGQPSEKKVSQKIKVKRVVKKQVHRAEKIALAQRGDPYSYGSAGPGGFDCSGLIYYSFRKAGFPAMPRTSSAQAGHVRRIAKSQLRHGDLMFFTGSGGVYHAGIFVGRAKNGAVQMLSSSTPGRPVEIDVPWTSSWFAGTVRRA